MIKQFKTIKQTDQNRSLWSNDLSRTDLCVPVPSFWLGYSEHSTVVSSSLLQVLAVFGKLLEISNRAFNWIHVGIDVGRFPWKGIIFYQLIRLGLFILMLLQFLFRLTLGLRHYLTRAFRGVLLAIELIVCSLINAFQSVFIRQCVQECNPWLMDSDYIHWPLRS